MKSKENKMQDLLKSPLIKVVQTVPQTVPKDNHELATTLWHDNKLSAKGRHYHDYYPVIIKTTPRQLITANDVCTICETHLLALLSELIDSITNIDTIKDLAKLNTADRKLTLPSPLNYLKMLLKVAYNSDPDPDLAEKNFQIRKQQIQSHIGNLQAKPFNYKKYLIIVNLYDIDNYHKLENIDHNLNYYYIANIADIFEKLIHYLTSDLVDNEFTYQISQNANLSEYEKWLNIKENHNVKGA